MPAPDELLRIRHARGADLDALLALEQQGFRGDRLSRRQYRHHLRNPRARLLAADAGGRLAGSALLLFRRGARVARLYSLAVDPAWRGHGVGRRLLDACEREAGRRGCTHVRLEVRVDNQAAQALYEGRGYRRTGQRVGYYEDGVDAWRYEKRIDASRQRRAEAGRSPDRAAPPAHPSPSG